MCAASISLARMQRLFYGASDNKYGAIENDLSFFKRAESSYTRPEIYGSICSEEARELTSLFFQNLRKLN
jgi:tRNA(adenine34) deaminase